jgi:anti-anti-sigma factor
VFDLHQKVTGGPLTVRSTPYGDWVIVVSLIGELDNSNVACAARAVNHALASEDMIVVIDLQELEFLDSSGIALLSNLHTEKRANSRIRVVPSCSLGVTRILAATGLDGMLKIVQDGVGGIAPEADYRPVGSRAQEGVAPAL